VLYAILAKISLVEVWGSLDEADEKELEIAMEMGRRERRM
jgi:hypothetical protein